jgi:Domain of unknown function (DUF2760)
VSASALPFVTRLWFAVVCLFRVLADGAFAARAWAVRDGMPELPPERASAARASDPPSDPPSDPDPEPESAPEPEPAYQPQAADPTRSALILLALLQREGRLVDFLEQDISSFDDADVGVAARVVHEGCREALRSHASIEPVRDEDEEAKVSVSEGIDDGSVKLTGNVTGKPPFDGILRHRGWRMRDLRLPELPPERDASVVAPAEVEL